MKKFFAIPLFFMVFSPVEEGHCGKVQNYIKKIFSKKSSTRAGDEVSEKVRKQPKDFLFNGLEEERKSQDSGESSGDTSWRKRWAEGGVGLQEVMLSSRDTGPSPVLQGVPMDDPLEEPGEEVSRGENISTGPLVFYNKTPKKHAQPSQKCRYKSSVAESAVSSEAQSDMHLDTLLVNHSLHSPPREEPSVQIFPQVPSKKDCQEDLWEVVEKNPKGKSPIIKSLNLQGDNSSEILDIYQIFNSISLGSSDSSMAPKNLTALEKMYTPSPKCGVCCYKMKGRFE